MFFLSGRGFSFKQTAVFFTVSLVGLLLLAHARGFFPVKSVFAATTVASDTFGRTTASGWGTADTGGSYTLVGSSSNFSTDGSSGSITTPTAGSTGQRSAVLTSVSAQDVDLTVKVKVSALPVTNNAFAHFLVRYNSSNAYRGQLQIDPAGAVTLQAATVSATVTTTLGSGAVVSGLTATANSYIDVHMQVTGTNPTTINMRAWADGDSEPGTWTYTTTDSSSLLQSAGSVGLMGRLSSSTSNAPITFTFDDFTVTTTDVQPTATPTPTNAPTNTPTPTPSYTLSGTVYTDTNSNGSQDVGETGYDGATVALSSGGTTTTDSSGNYSFSDVAAGTYTVTLTEPSGQQATTANPAIVPVSADTTQNFGVLSVAASATPVPGASIALRSVATANNGTTGTELTIAAPPDVTTNDIMVAHIAVATASATITPPTDWNLIRRDQTSTAMAVALYYKVGTSSEPTSYTWSFDSSRAATGGIADYSGVDTTTPVATSSGLLNNSNNTITASSVVTSSGYSELLFFAATSGNTVVTVPSGMTKRYGLNDSSTGSGKTVAMGDELLVASGSTGNKIGSEAVGATLSNIGQLVALNPATLPTNTPTPTPSYTLSGTVYTDSNDDGIQDHGEAGYEGVTVALTDGGTTTTDTSGQYSFSSLTAGTYTVTITLPAGYEETTTNPVDVPVSTDTTQNFGIDVSTSYDLTAAADTFTRTTSDGWGDADTGGTYTTSGTSASDFNVTGSTGTILVSAAGTSGQHAALLKSTSVRDVDETIKVKLSALPVGGNAFVHLYARNNSGSTTLYRSQLQIDPAGAVSVQIASISASVQTSMGNAVTVSGLTYTPGDYLHMRFQATGASPTTLKLKAWADGDTEPTSWQFVATDNTSGLQAAGALGILTRLSSTVTNTPLTFTFDDYTVDTADAATPTPTPTESPTPTPLPPDTPTPVPGQSIFLRAKSTGTNGSSGTSVTITKPSGTTTDDVMIAQIAVATASATITAPTGWTQIERNQSSTAMAMVTYYKVATVSEPASYTFSFDVSKAATAGIVSYYGVDTDDPIHVSAGQFNGSSNSVTSPSVTTTTSYVQLLYFGAVSGKSTVNAPSGMTQEWDLYNSNSSSGKTITFADQILTGTGATGKKTGTLPAGVSLSNMAQLIALTPATVPSSFTLSGTIFHDVNGNAFQDSGETGYSGVSIALSGDGSDTQTSSASGSFSFTSLSAGTYTLTVTAPSGQQLTTSNPVSVPLSGNTTVNFGLEPTDVTISVNTNTPTTTSHLSLGVTHTQFSLDNWGDATAITNGTNLLKQATHYQNQYIYGQGAGNPEPSSGTYDWTTLDRRVTMMRSVGSTMVVTLEGAPDWMTSLGTNTSTFPDDPPTPDHYTDFANLAVAIAQRYPDITYFSVWSEMKGFFNSQTQNSDYEAFTNMYNTVYDALKAYNPNIKVGGPYLAYDNHPIAGSWTMSSDDKDVLDYWLVNAHGADFLTADHSIVSFSDTDGTSGNPPGDWTIGQIMSQTGTFEDITNAISTELNSSSNSFGTVGSWAESLPIWWVEDYFDSDLSRLSYAPHDYQAAVLSSMLYHEIKGGASASFRWGPQGRISRDYSGDQESLFSDTQVSGGGQEFTYYDAWKNFYDYFSTGTQLYQATSSSPNVEVLASGTKVLLINKSANALTASVNGSSVSLTGYEVKVIDNPNGATPTAGATATPTPTPPPTYRITGTVYTDTDGNGSQDTGESGYQGATVTISGGSSGTTTTDASGNYSFSSLSSGTYTIGLTVPSGQTATTTNPVELPVATDTIQNFGLQTAVTGTPEPSAISISSISTSVTQTSTTVTWATSAAGDSSVSYGLDTSYGSQTVTTDASGTTDHSVTISSLPSCTTFHLQAISTDTDENTAVSDDQTVTTGCQNHAGVLASTADTIASSGGTLILADANNYGIILAIPANTVSSATNFQIHQIDATNAMSGIPLPSGYSPVSNYVYDITALTDIDTTISSFSQPITVTISYNPIDVTGFQESTFLIGHFHNGTWENLSGCTRNTSTAIVQCTTTSFSTFSLIGIPLPTTSVSVSNSSPSFSTCTGIPPHGIPQIYQASTKMNEATIYLVPNNGSYSSFTVSYGPKLATDTYSYTFNIANSPGAVAITIGGLQKSSYYTFKVRANNGCVPGNNSAFFTAKTTASKKTTAKYFLYQQKSLQKSLQPKVSKKKTRV